MIKLSKTEIIEISSLTRKRQRIKIYNRYRVLLQDDEKVISRATMYK